MQRKAALIVISGRSWFLIPWIIHAAADMTKKMKPNFEYEKLSESSRAPVTPVKVPNQP